MSKSNNLTDYLTDLSTHLKSKAGIPASTPLNAQDFSSTIDSITALNGETRSETLSVSPTIYTPSSGKNAITSITITAQAGSATTPATTITATPVIDEVLTTEGYEVYVNASRSITPTVSAGWVSSGTTGTVTVFGNTYMENASWTLATDTPIYWTDLEAGKMYKLNRGYFPENRFFYTPAEGSVQTKDVTLTSSPQTFTPSPGYIGISSIKVTGNATSASKSGGTVSWGTGWITSGSQTVTSSDLGYTTETVLNTNVDDYSCTVYTQNTKGCHDSVLSTVVTPQTLELTLRNSLTKSGGTVSIPAGSYNTDALSQTVTKEDLGIYDMTLPTSTSSTAVGTQKAIINANENIQYINIPAGYNTTEANYRINAIQQSMYINFYTDTLIDIYSIPYNNEMIGNTWYGYLQEHTLTIPGYGDLNVSNYGASLMVGSEYVVEVLDSYSETTQGGVLGRWNMGPGDFVIME